MFLFYFEENKKEEKENCKQKKKIGDATVMISKQNI